MKARLVSLLAFVFLVLVVSQLLDAQAATARSTATFTAIAVSAGGDYSCAIVAGGTVRCWCRN